MADMFKLPLVDTDQSIDDALRRLRKEGVHAVVVTGDKEELQLATSEDILKAKARGSNSMQEVRSRFVVAKPAVKPSVEAHLLVNDENWAPKLFGKSRARFVVIGKSDDNANATLLSRHEVYVLDVSGGMACICTNLSCPDRTGASSATHGQQCPICMQGTMDCY